MEDKNQNIAITITLLVVIIFFGGWYIYFGQLFNQAPKAPINTNPKIAPSGIISPTTTPANTPVAPASELPTE